MLDSRDKGGDGDLGFSWGTKRKKGFRNNEMQFYESFTYDDVEYFLYDSVYLYKDGEPEPYIGKLIRIWKDSNKERKVRVLWFFKPSEISYYLGNENVLQNELFLASGEGVGLADINPLEAIAGKCNVVCISKDERNERPSDEEIEKADFVFHRTFDVGNFTISDKLGEKIAATKVRDLLNKKDYQLQDASPENVGNVVVGIDKSPIFITDTLGEDNVMDPDASIGSSFLKTDKGTNAVVDNPKSKLSGNYVCAEPDDMGPGTSPSTKEVTVSAQKAKLRSPYSSEIDLDQVIKSAADITPSKFKTLSKSKPGGSADISKTKNEGLKVVDSSKMFVEDLALFTAADTSGKSKLVKSLCGSTDAMGKEKFVHNRSALEKKLSKKLELDGTAALSSHKHRNDTKKSLEVSAASTATDDKGNFRSTRDSLKPSGAMGKSKFTNSRSLEERPSKKINLDGTDTPLIGMGRDGTQKTVSPMTNKTSRPAAVTAEINNGGQLAKKFGISNNGHSKKFKFAGNGSADAVATAAETNDRGKLGKEFVDACIGMSKNLKSKDMIKNKPNEGLHKVSLRQSKKVEIKAYSHVKDVTQCPKTGKSHWFNRGVYWGQFMKDAQNQGRLVLLQNLDPAYTSSEVEDIVWHAFGESCEAKMVQTTLTSSPFSGQAFVVFKSREVAEKAINELDQECLMLPNGRPLVGSPWVSSLSVKHSSFPGHLVIDKLRRQMQRDATALSTSHSTQSNTLEYDMSTEWCLLQDRADLCWKLLHKEQEKDLGKLEERLKMKA